MDQSIQLNRSELLQKVATPNAGAADLSAQTWGDWAKEHKAELVGAGVVIGIAAAVGGCQIYRNLSGRLAAKAEGAGAALAEGKLANTLKPGGTVLEAKLASTLKPGGAVLEGKLAGALPQSTSSLAHRLERLPNGLPVPSHPPLPEISPGKVVPEAFSWGTPPATAGVGLDDSRNFLSQLAAGNTRVAAELESRTAMERVLEMMQKARPLSGTALQQREASLQQLVQSGATPQAVTEWVVSHSIHDHGTVQAAAIVDGKVTRELLGLEIQQGTRPLIEEMIVDVQRSTNASPFNRHMPAIARFEMPALSVNKPKKPGGW